VTGGRRAVRHGLILGWTISAIAIASVVAVGIPVAGAASPGIVGNGTDGHPYTVGECPQAFKGSCAIEFNSVSLGGFESKHTLAYACPNNYPYLTGERYSPGRIVPTGVQINEPGGIGVTITSIMHKRGTLKADGDGITVDYPIGILSGGSATNWVPLTTKSYSITLHCTANSSDGYPIPVKGNAPKNFERE